MKDDLGDRMKSYYEDRTRISLPRRTFTVIRIDGKAFHTYTRGLKRPFDVDLINDLDETTRFLCQSIQGVKMGYVQSDEISLLLTDFDKQTTDAWFDGNLQKMASISASMATSKFNHLRLLRSLKDFLAESGLSGILDLDKFKLAHFDSRVFTIPSLEEVINYFIWRQQDASRNSVSSVAQSMYSHKELNGKTTGDMQELIFQRGHNWNDYPVGQKRGRTIVRRPVFVAVSNDVVNKAKDKSSFVWEEGKGTYGINREQWVIDEPPIFTQDKDYIRNEVTKKVTIKEV